MTSRAKKAEERRFVRRFFECRPDLDAPWAEGPEPPDFDVGMHGRTSLEVTRLSGQSDMAHRAQLQRFEKEFEAALMAAGLRGVFGMSYNDDRGVLTSRDARQEDIQALVNLVRTRIERADPSHVYPPELRDIGISWINDFSITLADRILFTRGRFAEGGYEQRVCSAIANKAAGVRNYPLDRYDRHWLLLVTRGQPSEPRVLDIPTGAKPNGPFDRIFFLDLLDATVAELR